MKAWFKKVWRYVGKGKKVMWILVLAQVCVGIWQIALSRKLSDHAKHEMSQLKQELAEKATKEDLREVEDSIDQTLRRRVREVLQEMAEVLQEMAEQYASRWSADQQESSGVDSR